MILMNVVYKQPHPDLGTTQLRIMIGGPSVSGPSVSVEAETQIKVCHNVGKLLAKPLLATASLFTYLFFFCLFFLFFFSRKEEYPNEGPPVAVRASKGNSLHDTTGWLSETLAINYATRPSHAYT